MVKNQDFELYTGNSETVHFDVTDDLGSPVDFTGYTLLWTWREYDAGGAVVLTMTDTTGLVGDVNGNIDATVDGADTTGITAGCVYHELAASETATGKQNTLSTGYISLQRSGTL